MNPGAVFLSYSSHDAAAARRLADGLRAAGVEVWVDQSELRGGDAWDRSIRAQIKDCVLFVPLISANTQARAEGYFRLEWRLGVERSHLMADDHPFLLPVVIDDTAEATARVPDSFRERQWSRLAGGEPTPEFIARIERLLSGATEVAVPRRAAAVRQEPDKHRRLMRNLITLAAIVGATLVAIFGQHDDNAAKKSKAAPPAATTPTDNR